MSSKRRVVNLVSPIFLLSSISKSLLIKICKFQPQYSYNKYSYIRIKKECTDGWISGWIGRQVD